MCLSNPIRIQIGAASSVILPVNGNRIGLLFPPPTVANYSLDWGRPAVSGEGFTLTVGGHPLALNYEDWGCTLTREINAISAGAAFFITILELLKGDLPNPAPELFKGKTAHWPDLVNEQNWQPSKVPV